MFSLSKYVTNNGGVDYLLLHPSHYLMGDYASCNTTCVNYNNKIILNTRLVNYSKLFQTKTNALFNDENSQFYVIPYWGYDSHNVTAILQNQQLTNIKKSLYERGNYICNFNGFEDCKYVVWDEKLYAYGTRWDLSGNIGQIVIYEIDENMQPKNELIVQSPIGMSCEKNWGAIPDKPFHFIYNITPNQVVKVNQDGTSEIIGEYSSVITEPNLRGNCPLVKIDGIGYITFTHKHCLNDSDNFIQLNYYHSLVLYNFNMEIIGKTPWFTFQDGSCEFTCGMCLKDDKLIISYSQYDCTVNIIEVPVSVIMGLFNYNDIDLLEQYKITNLQDYYYNLGKLFEENDHIRSSATMHNLFLLNTEDFSDEKVKIIVIKFLQFLCDKILVMNSIVYNNYIRYFIQYIKCRINNFNELNYFINILNKYDKIPLITNEKDLKLKNSLHKFTIF